MKVLTWNMGYWGHAKAHDAAWHWLLDELSPDIALLQECRPPDWVSESGRRVLFDPAYPGTPTQPWGTALVTKGPATSPTRLDDAEAWLASLDHAAVAEPCHAARLRGWCVAANVTLPLGLPLLVVSIHSPAFPIAPALLRGRDLTAITLTLSQDVWLLDVVFHFLRRRLPSPLLVGGDFNYSRLLDKPTPRGNAEFFDRIAAEGFTNLHRLFHVGDEQTYFNPRHRDHQLDYLYADPLTALRTRACDVIPRDRVAAFSDHAPLIAELRNDGSA